MTELLKLAERVEAAEGPDMQLGHDVLVAVGQRHTDAVESFGFPASYLDPTASLDAAMSLVDADRALGVLHEAAQRLTAVGYDPANCLDKLARFITAAALRARAA